MIPALVAQHRELAHRLDLLEGGILLFIQQQSETKRRRRQTLTDKMIAALPKKRKRYTKADPEQRGHCVRVMPDGADVFVAVARDPYGKQV